MNGQRIIVSVVMSVYNGEKHLTAAIESILNQGFKDFEFIIIDDGSTDRSAAIIDNYAKNDGRIQLFHNESNVGLTASLNKGIKMAQGEYIARQDADDISATDRLLKLVTYLEHHKDCVLVASNVIAINDEEEFERRYQYSVKNLRQKLLRGNHFTHGSVCFVKKMFLAVGGYREAFRYAQDYDLFARLAERHEIAYLPEYLYRWRNSRAGISNNKFIEQLMNAVLIRCFIWERLRSGRDSYDGLAEHGFDRFLESYSYRDYFFYHYGRALFSLNHFQAARAALAEAKGFPKKYVFMALSFIGQDALNVLRKIKQLLLGHARREAAQ
jgi:glycosyltransferase involved in cell wall biosynthesis